MQKALFAMICPWLTSITSLSLEIQSISKELKTISYGLQAFQRLLCQTFEFFSITVFNILLLIQTTPGNCKLHGAGDSCDWQVQTHGRAVI